ncbi:MAG: hypothetical protein QME45_01265 [Clostridiales bacterium]|nr:hypothetical protein [Clostridiales bacterium]
MKGKLMKGLTTVITIVMVISMVGCGSNKGISKNSKKEVGQEDKIYWFSDVTGYGPSAWNTDSSPALDYIKNKIGITFNLEQPPTDADTKLGLMIASNQLPDMISVTDQDTIKKLIKSNKVWDMKSFFTKYDPDSHLLKDFPEDVKKALTDSYGGWYSYPSHMESTDNRKIFPPDDQVWVDVAQKGSNSCIMFNKEIMDALGITQADVSTEQGFLNACEKVKNSGHKVNGQAVIPLIFDGNMWIDASLDSIIAWNFGAVPVDADGNYRHLELSPGYKNALQFINRCIQKGYLDVNSLTIDSTAVKTYLDAKRVFCWIGNQANEAKDNMPWVSYGPIVADNNARPAMPVNKSAGTGWIQTLISKDCKNPEKLAKLISWASSREGLLINYYGEENKDYTIDKKGIVTKTESQTKKFNDDYKNNVLLWPFANTSFERNTEPVPDPKTNRGVEVALMPALGKYEKTYMYDQSLLGFLNSNVIEPSSDLGVKLSQIKTYLEQQKAKVVTAKSDSAFEKEYANMINTLQTYNINAVDKEYNKAFKENCEKTGEKIEDVNASLYK